MTTPAESLPTPGTPVLSITPRIQRKLTEEETALLKRTLGKKATEDDFALFVRAIERTGLDPFTRQIYLSHRREKNRDTDQWEDKHQALVSIDGLRLIAERTGEYEGQAPPQWCGEDGKWRDAWLAKTPPAAARVGVYRKGFREALYAVARFEAYAQYTRAGGLNSMWAKMGDNQLRKCAEALALRQAFPQECSGLYTDDEMGQATTDDETEERRPPRASRPASSEPSEAEQSQVAQRGPYDLAPEDLTLEQARALPLAGPQGSWGGKAGNPLGTFGPKAFGQFREYFTKQIDNPATCAVAELMLTAMKLIELDWEARATQAAGSGRSAEPDPTLGSAASGTEPPSATSTPAPTTTSAETSPSAPSTPASPPSSSPEGEQSPDPTGGEESSLEPPADRAHRLRQLAEHRSIQKPMREAVLGKLRAGTLDAAGLEAEIRELEAFIELMAPAPGDDDLPF